MFKDKNFGLSKGLIDSVRKIQEDKVLPKNKPTDIIPDDDNTDINAARASAARRMVQKNSLNKVKSATDTVVSNQNNSDATTPNKDDNMQFDADRIEIGDKNRNNISSKGFNSTNGFSRPSTAPTDKFSGPAVKPIDNDLVNHDHDHDSIVTPSASKALNNIVNNPPKQKPDSEDNTTTMNKTATEPEDATADETESEKEEKEKSEDKTQDDEQDNADDEAPKSNKKASTPAPDSPKTAPKRKSVADNSNDSSNWGTRVMDATRQGRDRTSRDEANPFAIMREETLIDRAVDVLSENQTWYNPFYKRRLATRKQTKAWAQRGRGTEKNYKGGRIKDVKLRNITLRGATKSDSNSTEKVTQHVKRLMKRHLKEEVIVENKKVYHNEKGKKTVKVYRDPHMDEHIVKHYINGIHQKEADYHTTDKHDAIGTANIWLNGKDIPEPKKTNEETLNEISKRQAKEYKRAATDDVAYHLDGPISNDFDNDDLHDNDFKEKHGMSRSKYMRNIENRQTGMELADRKISGKKVKVATSESLFSDAELAHIKSIMEQ